MFVKRPIIGFSKDFHFQEWALLCQIVHHTLCGTSLFEPVLDHCVCLTYGERKASMPLSAMDLAMRASCADEKLSMSSIALPNSAGDFVDRLINFNSNPLWL